MPRAYPFRGIRYHRTLVEDLGRLICPPYDVIGPEEQVRYGNMHPYNSIRLELPAEGYSEAAETLSRWMKSGILAQEERPAIYVYRQRFRLGEKDLVRTALLASVEVCSPTPGDIFPHEQVRPKPVEDRLNLLRATGVMSSPIFAICEDREGTIAKQIEEVLAARQEEQTLRFESPDGISHVLAPITETPAVERLQSALEGSVLLIADGHHRYETARRFFAQDSPRGSGRAMMAVVSEKDPGLVVLPTHRTVSPPAGGPRLTAAYLSRWVAEAYHGRLRTERVEQLESLPAGILAGLIRSESVSGSIGAETETLAPPAIYFYAAEEDGQHPRLFRITGDFAELMSNLAGGKPVLWRGLPVAALHLLVLDRLPVGSEIAYTHDAREAMGRVERGLAQAAFLLPPPPVSVIMELARTGNLMPAKSTYFYPKFPAGVVLHPTVDPLP